MSNDLSTGKSFGVLDPRNQGTQKILGWGFLAGLGFIAWYKILPYVLYTLTGTLEAIALGGIVLVLLYLLLDGRVRWLVGYGLQRIIGLLASVVVDMDPIGVMKQHLREVVEKIGVLTERIAEIRGAVEKGKRDLNVVQSEIAEAQDLIEGARRKHLPNSDPAVQLAANKIARRESTVLRIQNEIAQGAKIVDLLSRYLRQADAFRADMEDTITTTERERKRLKASSAAFRAARSILKGDDIGGEFYSDALERANEQAAAMIGEMQQFIDESHGALQGFELQQDGAVERVLNRFEQKEQGSKLLAYQPGVSLAAAPAPDNVPAAIGPDINQFMKK